MADFPSLPESQAQYTDENGRPTPDFYSFLINLRRWLALPVAMASKTVATLPAAASNTGIRYLVTNANSTTFMSIVASGGANIVPVFSDGTNWRIG